MKNTWAYGIISVFLFFIGLMVSMAVIASKNTEKLVVKDYYKAELQFQQQINKEENANGLATKPSITYSAAAKEVEVFFPKAIYADGVEGELTFYRANAPEMDMKMPVQLNTDARQNISTNKLQKGRWKIQLDWKTNGISYYTEQVINI